MLVFAPLLRSAATEGFSCGWFDGRGAAAHDTLNVQGGEFMAEIPKNLVLVLLPTASYGGCDLARWRPHESHPTRKMLRLYDKPTFNGYTVCSFHFVTA